MQQGPHPNTVFPLQSIDRLCFLKNIIQSPLIEVGDYTYYDDFENVHNFERNVRYHFEFSGDRLVIGRFCMIASDVTFIMNGANHLQNAVSAYPFAIFGNGWEGAMEGKQYPFKGDTVIGSDVWLGYKATIMAGVKIGHGAIIGAYSVVAKDVEPYTIVGGNPAKPIKKRFADDEISDLLRVEWWNWPVEKITRNVSALTGASVKAIVDAK